MGPCTLDAQTCLTSYTLSMNPEAEDGYCESETEVCITIDGFNQPDENYMHGVIMQD